MSSVFWFLLFCCCGRSFPHFVWFAALRLFLSCAFLLTWVPASVTTAGPRQKVFLGLQEEERCVHTKVQPNLGNRGGVRGEAPASLFGWTHVSPGWYSELWIIYFQSSGLQACISTSSLCGAGAGTQGLVYARRALYPLNHTVAPTLPVHFQPCSFLVKAESWIRITKALPKSEQADVECDSSLFPWQMTRFVKQQFPRCVCFWTIQLGCSFFQRQLPSVLQLLWKPV